MELQCVIVRNIKHSMITQQCEICINAKLATSELLVLQ